jgi:hypothetical protein
MLLSYEQSWKRIKRETGLSEANAKAALAGLPTFKDGSRRKYYCTNLDAVIRQVNTPPVTEGSNGVRISQKKRERIQMFGRKTA